MAKFPEPPDVDALKSIPPQTVNLEAGEKIFRVFRTEGPYPVSWNTFRYFGPTSSRFDHHLRNKVGQPGNGERGVLYGAIGPRAIPTCLAEFFQGTRKINRKDGVPVLSAFALTAPLTLLDLRGSFATQIGASMAINTGPRPRAQRWAQRLYEAYPRAHGIIYPSSMHANEPAITLWERSTVFMPRHPLVHRLLSDPALKRVILETADAIGYPVVDP